MLLNVINQYRSTAFFVQGRLEIYKQAIFEIDTNEKVLLILRKLSEQVDSLLSKNQAPICYTTVIIYYIPFIIMIK